MTNPTNPLVRPVRTGAGRGAALSLAAMALGSMVVGSMVVGTEAAHAATACVPTTESPTLTVDPAPVRPGSAVRVAGTGWCHPTDGGSLVALKIDEGAYSRLDTALHPNKTIWTLVEADPSDGTFAIDLQLPDGTLATSTPEFPAGTHNLRALTGSLKPGDVPRTLKSGDFVVGDHRPQGIPEPVAPEDLTAQNRKGLAATLSKKKLSVRVPGGAEGDWVFLTLLTPDGSPRPVWGNSWWRLDGRGRVTVPIAGPAAQGAHRLVVHDGNIGQVGTVRGWVEITFPTSKSAPTQKPDMKSGDKSGSTTEKAPSVPVPARVPHPRPVPAPARVPAALPAAAPVASPALPTTLGLPARTFASLPQDKELSARVEGDELIVRTERDDTDLFVHVYDASSSVAGGWAHSDARGRVRLDLRDLPDGGYRVSLTALDDQFAGWAAVELAQQPESSVPESDAEVAPEVTPAAVTSQPERLTAADGWLAGLGAALLAGVGLGRISRKEGAR